MGNIHANFTYKLEDTPSLYFGWYIIIFPVPLKDVDIAEVRRLLERKTGAQLFPVSNWMDISVRNWKNRTAAEMNVIFFF